MQPDRAMPTVCTEPVRSVIPLCEPSFQISGAEARVITDARASLDCPYQHRAFTQIQLADRTHTLVEL